MCDDLSLLNIAAAPGCIRQLVIQGEEVIFKDLDRSSTGVSNCPTCKDHPCQVRFSSAHSTGICCDRVCVHNEALSRVFQNGGRCEDSDASLYKCGCPRGFTGSNCQHHSSLHCHSGTSVKQRIDFIPLNSRNGL